MEKLNLLICSLLGSNDAQPTFIGIRFSYGQMRHEEQSGGMFGEGQIQNRDGSEMELHI